MSLNTRGGRTSVDRGNTTDTHERLSPSSPCHVAGGLPGQDTSASGVDVVLVDSRPRFRGGTRGVGEDTRSRGASGDDLRIPRDVQCPTLLSRHFVGVTRTVVKVDLSTQLVSFPSSFGASLIVFVFVSVSGSLPGLKVSAPSLGRPQTRERPSLWLRPLLGGGRRPRPESRRPGSSPG